MLWCSRCSCYSVELTEYDSSSNKMNVPKPDNIPFPFPCLMCMCLGGVRVPTSAVNGGHVQCTVYACMMLFTHTHTQTQC